MKIEVFFEGNRGVNALVKGHLVKTDQPVTAGGSNNAPAPFDLFLASLATCSGIYVKYSAIKGVFQPKESGFFRK
jgi:ribosomal protein S12 methylthiotransferase accessory factor